MRKMIKCYTHGFIAGVVLMVILNSLSIIPVVDFEKRLTVLEIGEVRE